jgi:hypothetical protein
MSLMNRVRQGLVGAALRFGVEEGITQVTKPRHRQGAQPGDGVADVMRAEVDDVGTVGLPSGETSLKELEESGPVTRVLGVSIEELRYMSGIKDPFGECKLDVSGLDFSELEVMRNVRNAGAKGLTDDRRRSLVEHVEERGVEAPNNRFRAFRAAGHVDDDE